jgi:tetratricopeptide (TPR) repeat protein
VNDVWVTLARPAADLAVRAIQRNEVVAVIGAPTTGKSNVLRLIAQQVGAAPVFWTRMPTVGDDAGPVALASLAAQLEPDVLAAVKDVDRPWRDKVDLVVGALAGRDAIVLVDDLRQPAHGTQPLVFDDQAAELFAALLRQSRIRLVTTSSERPPHRATAVKVVPTMDAAMVARAVEGLEADPYFAEAVTAVRAAGPQFSRHSPVEVRLAVDLVARGLPLDVVVAMPGPRSLARAFLTRLPRHEQLALQRLAVLRVPCDRSTVDEIAAIGGGLASRRWESVALYESGAGWVLPAVITDELRALAADGRLPPDPARIDEARHVAAQFHQRAFMGAAALGAVPDAVRHELELVHQLTQAGDAPALLARSLWFVTQYDALGRSVGLRGAELYRRRPIEALPRDAGPSPEAERYLRAALMAYDRALAHDPRDAYALHYRAYNADILAEDATAVYDGYRAALEVDADQVWHHGRFITFLITRGRREDARAAWDAALRQLDGLREERWFYDQLHRPVALLLLHRGNTPFAREVLADVPAGFAGGGWFPALERRLQVLEELADGRLVFPPDIPVDDRWKGPTLVWGAERPERWAPGWVEVSDDQRVVVRYAEQLAGTVVYGRAEYLPSQFRALCDVASPPAGTFVERLWFADRGGEVIRCHRSQPEDELPYPFPPSARYLNRRAADPR